MCKVQFSIENSDKDTIKLYYNLILNYVKERNYFFYIKVLSNT